MTTFNREDSLDLPVLAAAPEAPEAGRMKLFIGDDGKFQAIDDQGNVIALQAASGSSQLAAPVDILVLDAAYTMSYQSVNIAEHGSGQYAIVNFEAQGPGTAGYRFGARPNSAWGWTDQWEIVVAAGATISGTALIALDNGAFEYKTWGNSSSRITITLRLVGFIE